MKLQATAFLLTVLAAATSTVLAQPQLFCETSGGSPDAFDAWVMGNEMDTNNGVACQDRGTDCTQIWSHVTAAANLCGPAGRCVSFHEAAAAVRGISQTCQSGGRAGGRFLVSNGMQVHVFHT